jgi:hypothetical protein
MNKLLQRIIDFTWDHPGKSIFLFGFLVGFILGVLI